MKEKLDFDEEFDNDDLDNDDFGEENEKINPLVAAGLFLGLIIVAAFFCVILWSVTHKGNEDAQLAEATETMQETSVEEATIELETLETEVAESETVESGAANEMTEATQSIEFSDVDAEDAAAIDTTDLEYTPPVEQNDPNRITTQDGRVIIFTDCDDYVRPKEYVNLRTEPSTSQGENTVKCQITHADIVHRTGYSEDSGWSRVEFYGEVLYVVSSYVYNAEVAE